MTPSSAAPTRVRHVVLWLTVAVYMITYMDRVAISTAVPSIQKEFGFSLVTMGWILGAFQLSYAIFQIPGGWLGDRFGPRRTLTGIVMWWSAFTMATTMAWSAVSMAGIRFLFGMGEAGSFPVATRSLSRWMLPAERGFAQGITHAGARLGAALTPALAAFLIAGYGWKAPFICFGLIGAVWAVVWFAYYRDNPGEHAGVNAAEREMIQTSIGAGATRKEVPWRLILHSRQVWTLALMYFCYAYVVGVYLTWFPKYLSDYRGFSLREMGVYASLPLLAGTVGDVLGGTWSDLRAKRTGDLKNARRTVAITGFLVAAPSILLACFTPSAAICIAFSCLAMRGIELTVGVSWAVTLDIGGESAGSVSAVMNTVGNIGSFIASPLTAYLVSRKSWDLPFVIMAGLCVVASLIYLRIDASQKLIQ